MVEEDISSTNQSRRQEKPGIKEEIVVGSFLACGRCSFFLSGYRMIHNDFTSSVQKSLGGWINLSWNGVTRDLIQKSYGPRIEVDVYHYEGICLECQRQYRFIGEENTPILMIQVTTG